MVSSRETIEGPERPWICPLQMRTVLINNAVMESFAVGGEVLDSAAAPEADTARSEGSRAATVRLSALHPGDTAIVTSVGGGHHEVSAIERRLLELGFVSGERVEVVTEARPGRDPFVVRLGATTLALRRRDVESVWVAPDSPDRA
jgi:ferrous iron transport protein A